METQHLDVEQLSALLDGELAEGERSAVEAHLAGCATCRQELERLRGAVMLLRAVPRAQLPRSFAIGDNSSLRPLETDRAPTMRSRHVSGSGFFARVELWRALAGLAAASMVVVFVVDAVRPDLGQTTTARLAAPSAAFLPPASQNVATERGASDGAVRPPVAEPLAAAPPAPAGARPDAARSEAPLAPVVPPSDAPQSGAIQRQFSAPAPSGAAAQAEPVQAPSAAQEVGAISSADAMAKAVSPQPGAPGQVASEAEPLNRGAASPPLALSVGRLVGLSLGLLALLFLGLSVFLRRRA